MARAKDSGLDVREACIAEALRIIETHGVEQLSLREISRRLGVSHQAPYKHFPSREHVLAEIVRRAFDAFADYLDGQAQSGDPRTYMAGMGNAYFSYAQAHPLQYRLMFGTPLPDPEAHPEMMRSARHAFALLRDCLARLGGEAGAEKSEAAQILDALYVWGTLHGVATLRETSAVRTLGLPEDMLQAVAAHAMQRMGAAIDAAYPPPAP